MAFNTETIPVGYKQTVVGVIPEDWRVKELGTLLSSPPKYGINAPASTFNLNLPTYIRITDISPEGRFIHDSKASVNNPFSNLFQLSEGDVVFARTGASVGKSYMYNSQDGELVYAGFLIKVEPNIQHLYPKYLKFIVQTQTYWSWVLVNSVRSGQPGINGKQYATLPIPLPPTVLEQEKIAEAVNSVEILNESLKRLIEKKQDIKQGTMQKLLTGKTRLPGFYEEWESDTLGNIFQIWTGSSKSKLFSENGLNYVVDMGSVSRNGELLVSKKTNFSSDFLLRGDLIMPKDDIGVGLIIGRTAFIDSNYKYILSDHLYAMRCKKGDSKFFHYMINSHRINCELRVKCVGTAQLGLGLDSVRNQIISFPRLNEQQAIAEILSDMDAEISALEQRLEKAKAIKQGMMQQLLTGRIRLVEPSTPVEASA